MSTALPVERFATTAEFTLVVDGVSHRVAQVASSFLLLDRPTLPRPGDADLFIDIDGEQIHRHIHLLGEPSATAPRIAIKRLGDPG